MGQNHGGKKTENTGALRHLPPRRDLWKTDATSTNVSHTNDDAGKRSAVKVACCVWRGAVRTGLATVPRWLAYPTRIQELATQGKSIQDIAITLGIARNTVRKYLRHPELVAMPHPRPNRRSKLDPFKEPIKQWITEDHCYNCEAMLPRLLAMGYKGSLSILKAFVHPLRPPAGGHYPVLRYETKPGEEGQWASSNRASGQEPPSPMLMTSIVKLISGVSASMGASIAPPTNAPKTAGSRSHSPPCQLPLPGNGLLPKSAKSAGMATCPTMESCTGFLLLHPSPEAWSRRVSDMDSSMTGTLGYCFSRW